MRSPMFRSLLRGLQTARQANLAAAGEALPTSLGGPVTRRLWLKRAGAATGLAATAPFAHLGQAGAGAGQPRIAVIGAGLAGLNAAHRLEQRGLHPTVFEARQRVGGRVFSPTGRVAADVVTDLGGCFINTDHADMRALAREFAIPLFDRGADAASLPGVDGTVYLFDGRRVPEAELAEALRPLAAQITADADRLDADFATVAAELDQLSVADYLLRHRALVNAGYVRRLIKHSIRTEYGVEPEESSALQLLFNLPTVDGWRVEVLGASDEVFLVEGGSARIAQALARSLRSPIRLGHVLRRLEYHQRSYRLTFAGGQVAEADAVVLALPFPVLRGVELRVDLPAKLRRFIDEVDLGTNEKLDAGFRQRVWRRPGGFTGEAWGDLGFSQCWDAAQAQAGSADGALTFFLGGEAASGVFQGSRRDRARHFVRALARHVPGLAAAANGRFHLTAWRHDPFARGAYTSFKPGQLTTFGEHLWIEAENPLERQEVRVGRLFFAGEHLSDAFFGFMNGAAETGRLAAEALARHVGAGHHPTAA